MLQTGELVPHFTVRAVDGKTVEYSAIWQRRNLLLITLPADARETGSRCALALERSGSDLERLETVGIVTYDAVPGVPSPGALVADRWGEIACVAGADSPAELPSLDALRQWLHYVQMRCAECEGEAK